MIGLISVGVIVLALVMLAGLGSAIQTSRGGTPASPVDLKAGAAQACRAYVLARVKAPKTATFDDTTMLSSLLASGPYLVTGTVDSQNSFGAMLRTNWICQVKAPVNGQYDLMTVTFLPQ